MKPADIPPLAKAPSDKGPSAKPPPIPTVEGSAVSPDLSVGAPRDGRTCSPLQREVTRRRQQAENELGVLTCIFGTFASPSRHLVFDLNDFDETLAEPSEWDVNASLRV